MTGCFACPGWATAVAVPAHLRRAVGRANERPQPFSCSSGGFLGCTPAAAAAGLDGRKAARSMMAAVMAANSSRSGLRSGGGGGGVGGSASSSGGRTPALQRGKNKGTSRGYLALVGRERCTQTTHRHTDRRCKHPVGRHILTTMRCTHTDPPHVPSHQCRLPSIVPFRPLVLVHTRNKTTITTMRYRSLAVQPWRASTASIDSFYSVHHSQVPTPSFDTL